MRFFKGEIPDKRVNMITARMALTHSTGFPNWRPKGEKLTVNFLPGSEYSYSGEGYMLLQRVVEHIMRRPLNRLVRTYVFDPLGMENSSFIWEDEYASLMANGHNAAEEVQDFRKQKKSGAAYSMLTTAADYGKFVRALMYGEGLRKDLHREMMKPQIGTGYGEENGFAWGLGIGLQETKYGRALWHWGDNGIFKCYMVAIPKAKVGVVFFTNSSNGLSLGDKIVSFTLKDQHPTFQHLGYDQYDSPTQLIKMAITRGTVTDGVRVYREVKKNHPALGSPFNEESITRLGYQLMEQENIEAAIEIFKINIREFPDSWNGYDSLGEAYLLKGEEQLAIKNYQQSIRLNPNNENGKKMLEKILK
jgi:CubicO group peptidase (beta-lactamase class C family)